jgi:hypothetical protein
MVRTHPEIEDHQNHTFREEEQKPENENKGKIATHAFTPLLNSPIQDK